MPKQAFTATDTWTQDWARHLTKAYGTNPDGTLKVTLTDADVACDHDGITVSEHAITDAGTSVTFALVTALDPQDGFYVDVVVTGTLSNGDSYPRTQKFLITAL